MSRKKNIDSQYTQEIAKIIADFAKKEFKECKTQPSFSRYLKKTLQSPEIMPIASSISLLAKMQSNALKLFISEIKIDAFVPNESHHFKYYLSEIVRNILQSEAGKRTNIKGNRLLNVKFQRQLGEKYGFTQGLISNFLRREVNIETERLLDILHLANPQKANEFKVLISKYFTV